MLIIKVTPFKPSLFPQKKPSLHWYNKTIIFRDSGESELDDRELCEWLLPKQGICSFAAEQSPTLQHRKGPSPPNTKYIAPSNYPVIAGATIHLSIDPECPINRANQGIPDIVCFMGRLCSRQISQLHAPFFDLNSSEGKARSAFPTQV
jgi:hypothetical protein